MARKRKRAARRSRSTAQRSPSKASCGCNSGPFLAGVIVLALGLFFIVWGVSTQWATGLRSIGWVILSYIVGIILISTGKMLKWKGCGMCTVHAYHK